MYNIHSEELMNKSQVIEAFKKSAKNTKYVTYDEKKEVLQTKRTEIFLEPRKLIVIPRNLSCQFKVEFKNIGEILEVDDTIYFFDKNKQSIGYAN